MITRAEMDHDLAVIVANARARHTGRRQSVRRCRGMYSGKLCGCGRWTVREVRAPGAVES